MDVTSMFTSSSIQTVGGGAAAVMVLVQLIKNWPYLKKVPTQLLAVIIGELLVFTTSFFPSSLNGAVVLFLNGVLISSMAVGGWHIVSTTVGPVVKEG